MQLSPIIYHKLVRPKWITKMYIHNKIQQHFNFNNKKVLDFGAGTGANSSLSKPDLYIGTDPDENRVLFAKKLYPEYLFHIQKDNILPIENDSIDIILIVAVLHHIPPELVRIYMKEFKRVLNKKDGQFIIMEPCFFAKTHINNWFMKTNDKGDFIQTEEGYLNYFKEEGFSCEVINRYRKCFLYNELFFSAH